MIYQNELNNVHGRTAPVAIGSLYIELYVCLHNCMYTVGNTDKQYVPT